MEEDLDSISSYKGLIDINTLKNPYFMRAICSFEKKRKGTSLANRNCYPIKTFNDKYRVLVSTNPDGYLYRGDNDERHTLIPGLKRVSGDEKAAQWTKTDMFIEWLRQSSYYKNLSKVRFNGLYFDPDLEAIAQHYGFCTNYLDFTSDINVASFFAYTRFVDGTVYEPITEFKVHPKLYRIRMSDLVESNPESFKVVGFQCAARAVSQQAFAIDFSKHINLGRVEEITLDKNPNKAIELFNYFNQGKDLFPNDLLTNITNHLFKNKKELSKMSLFKYIQKEKISDLSLIERLSLKYNIIDDMHRPTTEDNAIIDLDIREWVDWLRNKTSVLEIHHVGDSENGKLKKGLEFLKGQISENEGRAIIIQEKK